MVAKVQDLGHRHLDADGKPGAAREFVTKLARKRLDLALAARVEPREGGGHNGAVGIDEESRLPHSGDRDRVDPRPDVTGGGG